MREFGVFLWDIAVIIAIKRWSEGARFAILALLSIIWGGVTTTTREYEVAYHSRLTLKGQNLHEPGLDKVHQKRQRHDAECGG
jgi:hypothetical protein